MDDIMLSGTPSAVDVNQNVMDQGVTDADLTTETGQEPADTPPDNNPDEANNDADGELGRRKKPGGWQRKLSRYERENAELKAQIASMNAPASPANEKPKLDDYDNYDDFNRATISYEVDKALQNRDENARKAEKQKQVKTQAEDWQDRIDQLDDSYDDYHQVVSSVFDPLVASGRLEGKAFIAEALKEAGPEVIYKVAKDPQLREKLLAMNPFQVVKEIERITSQTSSSTPAAKTVSKSPAPLRVPKGSPSSQPDLATLDTEAYLAIRGKRRR